ncbi:hypothetical protein CB1_000139006 [Camelus ferus]|nr:hypothetical protein CB1_000139006 [Camelus ferus]
MAAATSRQCQQKTQRGGRLYWLTRHVLLCHLLFTELPALVPAGEHPSFLGPGVPPGLRRSRSRSSEVRYAFGPRILVECSSVRFLSSAARKQWVTVVPGSLGTFILGTRKSEDLELEERAGVTRAVAFEKGHCIRAPILSKRQSRCCLQVKGLLCRMEEAREGFRVKFPLVERTLCPLFKPGTVNSGVLAKGRQDWRTTNANSVDELLIDGGGHAVLPRGGCLHHVIQAPGAKPEKSLGPADGDGATRRGHMSPAQAPTRLAQAKLSCVASVCRWGSEFGAASFTQDVLSILHTPVKKVGAFPLGVLC